MSLVIYKRIISDAFDSRNWNYSAKDLSEEKTVFSINFSSEEYGSVRCKIYIFDSGICDMEAVLPIKCNQNQYMELSYYLAKYNCQKRFATLRLDVDDGEIINGYSFVFNQATTPKDFLSRFTGTKDIDDSVMDEIIAICKKDTPIEKVAVDTTTSEKNGKHKLSL